MKSDSSNFLALTRYTKALSVALGYRDLSTRLHSDRVLGLCEEIGEKCGMSEAELGILRIGASFHDIGKIGIPDHVLLKPAKLDGSEWNTMRQHSHIGEMIIASIDLAGSSNAALVIRRHHEHYDGRGYPDGLGGEHIPLSSRIISIADSYDAMAVTRSYHRVRTHEEIMSVLREERGTKHDPELLDVFEGIIELSQYKTASH